MSNIFDDHLPPIPSRGAVEEPNVRSNKRRGIEATSSLALKRGAIRLQDLAEQAFETLHEAMMYAEYPVAVSAAKTALDRSGFGPTATLKVEDLGAVTTQDLAALALRLAAKVSHDNSGNDSAHNTDTTEEDTPTSIH